MRGFLTWLRWWRRPKYWVGPDLETVGAIIAGVLIAAVIVYFLILRSVG